MRKIMSDREKEKRQKKNARIIGILLIIIMFGSVFGIVVNHFTGTGTGGQKEKYNGYEFTEQDGTWSLEAKGKIFYFSYLPTQTPSVSALLKPIENYQNKPLYIISEDYPSEVEIYRNFNLIAQRMQTACLSVENCTGDYPIKTCSDNLIIIEDSSESSPEIIQSDNCVYIRGPKAELLKLTDEFLFQIIEVK